MLAAMRHQGDIVLRRLYMPRKNTDTHIVFGTGGWRAVMSNSVYARVSQRCWLEPSCRSDSTTDC